MNHATTTEKDAALRLMESVLRDGRPMAAEYPLVFEADAPGHVEIVEHDGEAASTCAWIARTLVAGSTRVPAALVGSVATAAEHRGKGLGTVALQRATNAAAADGAAISLLWADDPAWYQERGWVPFGSENIFVVEEANAFLLPDPVGIRPIEARDHAAVHALYEEHASRVERTRAETAAMLAVPGMDAYVCEHDGKITGYACMGRGEDLDGVVHEWGGSPEGVLPIVNRLWMESEGKRERLFMMIPDTEADFLAYFRFVRSNGAKGILAMAKLGDVEAIARTIEAATPDDVTVTAIRENAVEVTGPSGSIVLTDHEILLAICPPRGDRRVTDVVESEVGVALPELPLKPFVWGLDSI
jgi:GNAT superfamily N-acetyltransferase